MKSARYLLLFLWLLTKNYDVEALSSGAPTSACTSMVPGHQPPAQTTLPPFSLGTNSTTTFGGGKVLVRLQSQAEVFKGFFIQGRSLDADRPIGRFTTDVHKTISCDSGNNNAVTHSRPDEKSTVLLEWEAPLDFDGEVEFRASVVKAYATYWTGLRSPKVQVAKRSVSEAGAGTIPPQAPTLETTKPSATGVASSGGLYDGCGQTKTCYASPSNCIQNKNCQYMVTYTNAGNQKYEFELFGKTNGNRRFVAVGLSEDGFMGDDSVVICAFSDGAMNVYNAWNEGKDNKQVAKPQEGLTIQDMQQKDGNMYCKFYRNSVTKISNKNFDLDNEKYHVLLAYGPINQDNRIQYHEDNKIVSDRPVALGLTSNLQQKDTRLFKVIHGSLMIGAWVMAASCGILFARYYKKTWLNYKTCNIDNWFHMHRFFMIFTWCSTMTALILISYDLKEFRVTYHSLIGIVSIGLCFIQPFMALLRPHPGDDKRWIFNWAHWFVGNSAQILGITAIFFGIELLMSGNDNWVKNVAWYTLIAFIAFHCLTHIVLSIAHCMSDRKTSNFSEVYPLKELGGSRTPLHSDRKSADAPYGCFRKLILSIYLIINWCVTAFLIILVVFRREDIEQQFIDWKVTPFWK